MIKSHNNRKSGKLTQVYSGSQQANKGRSGGSSCWHAAKLQPSIGKVIMLKFSEFCLSGSIMCTVIFLGLRAPGKAQVKQCLTALLLGWGCCTSPWQLCSGWVLPHWNLSSLKLWWVCWFSQFSCQLCVDWHTCENCTWMQWGNWKMWFSA